MKTTHKIDYTNLKKILLIMVIGIFMVGFASAITWDNVAYYKLDETSGAVVDATGNGNNGTNNGATRGVTGKINNAFDFENTGNVTFEGSSVNFTDTDEATISFWFKSIDFDFGTGYQDTGENYIQFRDGGNIRAGWFNSSGSLLKMTTSGTNWADGNWNHFILVNNPLENMSLYINGNLEETQQGVNNIQKLEGYPYLGNFNGSLDEVGIWDRALTDTEVSELYNSGDGTPYEGEGLSVTLNSPENNSQVNGDVDFDSTLTPKDVNITNATLQLWDDSSLIYNKTETYTNQDTEVTFNHTILEGNFSQGDYYWNVLSCYENSSTGVNINCTSADNNYTFEWRPFEVTDIGFKDNVLETSEQDFNLTISIAEGFNVFSAKLIYNGSVYSNADSTSLGSGSYLLEKTIYIPGGEEGFNEENRSFYWNVTIRDDETGTTTELNTSSNTQTVRELIFGLCGGTKDVPMLNFTIYDESTSNELNAIENNVTFQGTFNIGADSENLLKNVSVDNQSVNTNEFDFCTDNVNNTLFADLQLYYTAVDYTDKDYFLNNATLDNNTNEVNLFVLPNTDAIEFFIDVTQDLDPLPGVTINIDKYFVGEGVYKTVEIDETDSDGEITAYLDLDAKYKFTLSKNGEVIHTAEKRASCEAAPCTISLLVEEEGAGDVYSAYADLYASNVLYNLSYNPNTKIVKFDFIDTTGLATYFRMVTKRVSYTGNSNVVDDQKLFTSSGSMTFNMSGLDDGDYKTETFISRSPEKTIDWITIQIQDITDDLGYLGLFISFIILLFIIFGLAFNPKLLVMAAPASITVIKFMGIFSINNLSITVLWVLAALAFFALER